MSSYIPAERRTVGHFTVSTVTSSVLGLCHLLRPVEYSTQVISYFLRSGEAFVDGAVCEGCGGSTGVHPSLHHTVDPDKTSTSKNRHYPPGENGDPGSCELGD